MFKRGVVVHHKVMGKGIVINEVKENEETMIEVRMANGHIQRFYPEELETDEAVQDRYRRQAEEVARGNEERARKLSGL